MTEPSRSPDALEEIDDPSELLSKPLEPLPLVPPSQSQASGLSNGSAHHGRRHLPAGFGNASSSERSRVWAPSQHSQSKQSASTFSEPSQNGLIIGGSGARVPTQFLDQNGGFARPPPPQHMPAQTVAPTASMPGAFPTATPHSTNSQPQLSQPASSSSRNDAAIDLTLSSDEDESDHKVASGSANGSSRAGPSTMSSATVPMDDDDDDDEPVIISHKRPEKEEFEIDHVKSNAIVCAGLINAVVLCMHGLPQALTFSGSINQEPPEDPYFSRENWPSASRFWVEKGYRPVMLSLSNPVNLPPASRQLPGGWSYTAMPPARPDINVSVLLAPLAAHSELPRDQAIAKGPLMAPAFGSLAEKYVTSMEPLLRNNKIRCEARCRMVPTGRAQNFLHYLEILVFARRPDLALISERLAAHGIQLEHPASYHPEDYPTEPQYTNPHNPPAGGFCNDHMSAYNGIYRGAGMGTVVQNREQTEKEKKAQVDAIYSSIRSGEELAAVEPKRDLISTTLLQHQKQALGFLLERERDRRWTELLSEPGENGNADASANGKEPKTETDSVEVNGSGAGSSSKRKSKKGEMDEDSISLWKVRKGVNGKIRAWRNLITNRETMTQPRICRGSILADDMGLGKTITTLALVAHTLQDAKAFGSSAVQREVGAELTTAMQAPASNGDPQTGSKGSKGKSIGAKNGKSKVDVKRRNSESSFDDDYSDDSDATPPLSLAVHNAPPAAKSSAAKGKGRKSKKDKVDPEIARRQHLECRSRATLIVCPLSVVSNWEEQFKEHWNGRKQPRIYIYHGPSRATNIKWIANHDIVITTYSTLGSEFSNQSTWVTEDTRDPNKRNGKEGARASSSEDPAGDDEDEIFMVNENGIPIEDRAANGEKSQKRKRKPAKEALNPLQRIEWFRVVLDEAHQIKGAGTWQSKAVCNLSAQRRLCLTGTPIQNTISDLFALVKFLRLDPFTDRATWNEFCGLKESNKLKAKSKEDELLDSANLGHVQILMKFLALRRQKTTKTADGKQLLTLPPKLSKTEYLEFEESEKARYQALHNLYKEDFEEMMAGNTVNNNYATILHEILNLRMTCDHPSMVDASKDAKRKKAGADLFEAIKQDGLSRERAAVLFTLFRDSEMAYCLECQADVSAGAERDAAGNDPQELMDALDVAASGDRNGKRPAKRTRIEPGMGGSATASTMSGSGLETPAEGMPRPVVTRCQHIFCSPCFRRLIGAPWPNVVSTDVGRCPSCSYSLQLAIDAVELEPSDFADLNDDQAERFVDEDPDWNDLGGESKAAKDEAQDDFDWGSGDEKTLDAPTRPKAPRKKAAKKEGSPRSCGDVSLEGRKDLSTKIRALISDLLPFSKCNPHSALYDPTAPRLLHIDPSTSDDPEVRKVEDPVVVIQKPPPAITSSGLLGKLDHTMEVLDSYEPVKSIVFSQWTKMLDRIQKSLSLTGIRMVRLDGTMKRSDRTAALETFRTDPSIEVLLVSLRAGGTGLNLVTACRAYLMDPYWNPAVENQGLDRVHRMGQTRPVITTKYIMRHSIEENMLRLQKRKMMLAEKVGSKRQIAGAAAAGGGAQARREERREELKILFGTSNGGVEL